MKEFTIYDKSVDIVSCLESFFKNSYKDELIYFDRFPSISLPSKKLRPDFTLLFDNYGLIFEVKNTFPNEDIPFKKELKQLLTYDANLSFKCDNKGNRKVPDVHDIVLIIDSKDSNSIFKRINHKIKNDSELKFENHIIYLDYNYSHEEAYYSFEKYAGEGGRFRDSSLPLDKQLEKKLGEKGESIRVNPDKFLEFKSNNVICNDAPPKLYMAVILWSKIFYYYLDAEQKSYYMRGNPKKIQPIKIKINELMNDLNNKYIYEGGVRRSWIRKTLEFLQEANLASIDSNNEATIYFRNFKKSLGYKKQYNSQGAADHNEIHDIGNLIVQEYCKAITNKSRHNLGPSLPIKKSKQTSLGDISTS